MLFFVFSLESGFTCFATDVEQGGGFPYKNKNNFKKGGEHSYSHTKKAPSALPSGRETSRSRKSTHTQSTHTMMRPTRAAPGGARNQGRVSRPTHSRAQPPARRNAVRTFAKKPAKQKNIFEGQRPWVELVSEPK